MSAGPYTHPPRVRRVLESLVGVVCPPEAAELGLAPAITSRVQESMRALPPHFRVGLISGLLAYEVGSMANPRHLGVPASSLAPAHAARYFARWWHGKLAPQRELVKGVKGLLCLACCEMPEIKERLNYRPERWIELVKARRLARYGADIERHEAALVRPEPLSAPSTGERG
jgi:hypothetical protein